MARAHWVLLIGFGALSACGVPPVASGRNHDSQLITEEEVAASPGTTAFEVIHNLRPNFLSYRGETSFDKRSSRPYPNVYVDDQPFGPVSILNSIPSSDVSTIRLYRSWEATTKYGSGNAGGVIAISTRH
jgi:TonB-dependent Receptor Plug Domain